MGQKELFPEQKEVVIRVYVPNDYSLKSIKEVIRNEVNKIFETPRQEIQVITISITRKEEL